ncbi:hypothetical protein [Sphingosinithalassobacter sp. CS137]|uniref:hypothetical protein n=1 Tax=Sphingosinithalassobacter sp. CS137 TaxID=2762748 RepID=UPI0021D04335|nr:hypothetical protein [Sphingosinithalassobacter sp. CS137]
MNQQSTSATAAPIIEGAPEYLTLPFVLIAIGVLVALAVLLWGARRARERRAAEHELTQSGQARYVDEAAVAEPPSETERTIAAPPVAPAPPPVADAEVPAAEPEPVPQPRPEPATETVPPAGASAPAPASDDLTRMKGVGPRLAERLNGLGITRFEQIAALSPEDAAALDAQLGDFRGRLERDRWIEQAELLAKGDIAAYEERFGKL